MSNNQSQAKQDVSELRRHEASTDIETPTTEQARRAAHKLVDQAADKAEGAEARLREEAGRLGEVAGERKELAQQKLEDGMERANTFIRERPLAAAGIAFAAGAVTALLLRRS